MTAKDKAIEILNKMHMVDDVMGNYPMCFDTAKQCATISVNEILKVLFRIDKKEIEYNFWLSVKFEIEKL